MERKVYLIDGTSFAYRAFYAIPHLSTSKGLPTNAVYGFMRMFFKLIKELKPDYLGVAFDVGRATFREKILETYKANRKPAPDDFKVQLPWIKRFLECLGVKVLQREGFEADDVIGTVAKKLAEKGIKVVIVTPDKDMRQLIDENISVLSVSQRGGASKLYDLKTFMEEYGYHPSKIPDVFALSGDTVDNIPGVPGFGEKTASSLIRKFGSVEELYRNLDRVGEKRRKLLEENREMAFKSKELATIDTSVPVEVSVDDLKLRSPDADCLKEVIAELEMKSLLSEVASIYPDLSLGHGLKPSREVKRGEFLSSVHSDLFSLPELVFIVDGKPIIAGKGFHFTPRMEEVPSLLPDRGKVYVFDLKSLYHLFGDAILGKPLLDVSLADYLLNPLSKDFSPRAVFERNLDVARIDDLIPISHYGIDVGRKVLSELKRENLFNLYSEIELPLSYVLYRMERRGVLFDIPYLKSLKEEIAERVEEVEREIFRIAGEEFNVNSPKQLSRVLFEKMSIPPVKRTKSGYSTDVEVLTTLSLKGYRIAELLLDYRRYSKLMGTFVDGILKRADGDGRVHTTFIQTGTATGRLSSIEPNLQNLPVYDEFSKRIRHAVVSPDGFSLLWADYSQIELRVLAHLSADERLIEAFRAGSDIHRQTASFLFNVSPESVDDRMRRVAKMVNFGIIYGMSPQGLSQRLGIPVDEAEDYIRRYFDTFSGVRGYIESVVDEAHEKLFVRTLFGRRRPVPELLSKSRNMKKFGERAAFNAVIQGTAADIMKLSMVNLFNELKGIDSHMVLQVHDEVVVEVPDGRVKEAKEVVREVMENSVSLSVPLSVDVKVGKHWS